MRAGSFWHVVEPSTWPSPPVAYSPSSIGDVERCPRRWALENADFSNSLSLARYPRRPSTGALRGEIVHSGLEYIVRKLRSAGCDSANDPVLHSTLQEMGGLRKVVRDSADRCILNFQGNPRFTARAEYWLLQTQRMLADCRMQLQTHLMRVLRGRGIGGRATKKGSDRPGGDRALGPGLHTEHWLRPASMQWKGKADLIAISDEACEIVDYKTGEASPKEHAEQLRIYALLWLRDRAINPMGRQATALTLSYKSGQVSVPVPTAAEYKELEASLNLRADEASRLLSAGIPEARPSQENCRFCGVRQLCEEFWRAPPSMPEERGPQYSSAQVRVRESSANGGLFYAETEASDRLEPGHPVTVAAENGIQFAVGDRLRLIDVACSEDDETGEKWFHQTRVSEFYWLAGG